MAHNLTTMENKFKYEKLTSPFFFLTGKIAYESKT